MIREMSKTSFGRIKKSYFKVFSGNNPFEISFKKEIEKISVIYPVDGYKLTEEQFNSLIQTLISLRIDEEVLVSEIEAELLGDVFIPNVDTKKYDLKHWSFDLSTTYDEYSEMDINVENAIYSSNGNWGIMISHEEHAIIGGSADFFNVFKMKYAQLDKSFNSFQEYWEHNRINSNSKLEWYDSFIYSLKR